jgi:hypothetical protein
LQYVSISEVDKRKCIDRMIFCAVRSALTTQYVTHLNQPKYYQKA